MGHHTITTELQWSQGQLTNIHIHTDATYMWCDYTISNDLEPSLFLYLGLHSRVLPLQDLIEGPPHSPLTWSMYTQVGGNWKRWWSKISPAWNTYTTDAAFEQHCDSTTTILSLLVHPFLPPFSLIPSHSSLSLISLLHSFFPSPSSLPILSSSLRLH